MVNVANRSLVVLFGYSMLFTIITNFIAAPFNALFNGPKN
ncbi:hypothetical protein PARC_a2643 [Pseudoalteromonas arctica A 37-1-2]|uniref:Uncharacterized protein n=1 Tax=Pseudoalteromonas arctica A 37-1-2 TaxID=1117313 RepID=A0A290S6E0_9GAMM|nr:hypothetical protein PARC_a2643 [Pseudoalteromonas arctica A 37-1-2]